jgi:hypothetical protein
MKRLLATVFGISALAVGCRSVPIAVPDLPAEQLLVNQANFENAVNRRILGSCEKSNVPGTISQTEQLGKTVLCDTRRYESRTK